MSSLVFFKVNSTSFITTTASVETSSIITHEPWFILFDIVMILSSALSVVLSALFLLIIIVDKTCYTVPMMLVANTCLSGIIIGCSTLSLSAFTFQNDLKKIHYQDSLCIFRAYLGYSSCALFCFSFLLQATYRCIVVMYPTHLWYQSFRFQSLIIGLTWIFCFVCVLPLLFTGDITYNVDNQICQVVLRLSFATIYTPLIIYVIPILALIFVYFKLVRYVHEMRKRVTPVNTLSRAQQELKMVRRTATLVVILSIFGCPYIAITFMSYFTAPPRYQYRVAFIFLDVSLALVMIILFPFTDPLKASATKTLNGCKRSSDDARSELNPSRMGLMMSPLHL